MATAQEMPLFVDGGPSTRIVAPGTTAWATSTGLIRYRVVRVDEKQLADAFADANRGNDTPLPELTLNLFEMRMEATWATDDACQQPVNDEGTFSDRQDEAVSKLDRELRLGNMPFRGWFLHFAVMFRSAR